MGILTDTIREAGRQAAAPSGDGAGVGQIGEREQAIIDRHKAEAGNRGSLFQDVAQARAEREIGVRKQQRAYAEQAMSTDATTVDLTKEMLKNLNNRAMVLDTYSQMSPAQRQEALKLAPGLAQQIGDDRGGLPTRAFNAVIGGIGDVAQPAMEFAGQVTGTDWGGTPEEIEFIRQLQGAASQEFAPARPGDPWYEKAPLQALQQTPWMATTIGGGIGGGAAAKAGGQLLARGASAGVPGAKAVFQGVGAVGKIPKIVGLKGATTKATMEGLGTVAGITAAGFPSQYAQEVDQLKELGMVDDTRLRLLAGATALVASSLESIIPNPLKAGPVSIRDGAVKAARQYLWNAAKQAPGEMTEEYLQGVTSGLGQYVAQYVGSQTEMDFGDGEIVKFNPVERKSIADAFQTGYEQAKEAALPMAFLLGVPAVGGAGRVALKSRGFNPEAIAKNMASLDKPPGAHKWAEINLGDRSRFKDAPDEATRAKQWEQSRGAVQPEVPQNVSDMFDRLKGSSPENATAADKTVPVTPPGTQSAPQYKNWHDFGTGEPEGQVPPPLPLKLIDKLRGRKEAPPTVPPGTPPLPSGSGQGTKPPPLPQTPPALPQGTLSGKPPLPQGTKDATQVQPNEQGTQVQGQGRGQGKPETRVQGKQEAGSQGGKEAQGDAGTEVQVDPVTKAYKEAEAAGEFYAPKTPMTEERLADTLKQYRDIFNDAVARGVQATPFITPGSKKQAFYDVLANEAGGTIDWTETGKDQLTGKFVKSGKPPATESPKPPVVPAPKQAEATTATSEPAKPEWDVRKFPDGKLYRTDPNAKSASERMKTRQPVDPSGDAVLITHDQFGKPIPEETLKARQEFVDKAKPGTEFRIPSFNKNALLQVQDDGTILSIEGTAVRAMSSVSEMVNTVKPDYIAWEAPSSPTASEGTTGSPTVSPDALGSTSETSKGKAAGEDQSSEARADVPLLPPGEETYQRANVVIKPPYKVGGRTSQVISVQGRDFVGLEQLSEEYPDLAKELRSRVATPKVTESQPESKWQSETRTSEARAEVPFAETFDDIAKLPKHAVYQRDWRGGRKFMVRSEGERGGGDGIFDTEQEAREYADTERTRENQRVESEQRRTASEAEAQRKEKEYVESFKGFDSDSPMKFGKSRKVLEKRYNDSGTPRSRKEIIEDRIANGWTIKDDELQSPDGDKALTKDDLTSTGWRYAEHLLKGDEKPSPENRRGPKDQPGAKQRVYREMAADELDSIINPNTSSGETFGGTKRFWSDNPDLAIGQGTNKGFVVELDPSGLSLKEHAKPGTAVPGVGKEFTTSHRADEFRPGVRSVTVKPGANSPSAIRVKRFLEGEVKAGKWSKSKAEGSGVVYSPVPNEDIGKRKISPIGEKLGEQETGTKLGQSGEQVGNKPKPKSGTTRSDLEEDANEFIGALFTGKVKAVDAEEAWQMYRRNVGADTRGTPVIDEESFKSNYGTYEAAHKRARAEREPSGNRTGTKPAKKPEAPTNVDKTADTPEQTKGDGPATPREKRGEERIPISGEPFTFTALHNKEKSPNMGARFGQDKEPAGRYVTAISDDNTYLTDEMPDKYERGEVTFENPLVIEFGGGYQEATNWKQVLSDRYGGLTGKALSSAVRKDGHDGIITVEPATGPNRPAHTAEIVDLRSKKATVAPDKTKATPEPKAKPSESVEVEAEPKTKPPADEPIPKFNRTTPDKGSTTRQFQAERVEKAKGEIADLERKRRDKRGEHDKLRSNATKKRAAVRGEIESLNRMIGKIEGEIAADFASETIAKIEDELESPRSYDHYIAGMKAIHRLKASAAEDAARRGEIDREAAGEEVSKEQREADRFDAELQGRAKEIAKSQGFDSGDAAQIALAASNGFTVFEDRSLADIVEVQGKRTRESRVSQEIGKMFSPGYAAKQDLSDEQKEAFKKQYQEASLDDKDWLAKRGEVDKSVNEAISANREAIRQREDAERKEKEAEKAKDEQEALANARERAKKHFLDERISKALKKQKPKTKPVKVRRESVGGPAKIVSGKTIDGDQKGELYPNGLILHKSFDEDSKDFVLTHARSGSGFPFSAKKSDMQELIGIIDLLGIDFNVDTDEKGALPSELTSRMKKINTAWDNGDYSMLSEEDYATVKALAETAKTDIDADLILTADDLGANGIPPGLGNVMTDKGLRIVKEMATAVPEFAYDPVFTVQDGKLLYRDGYEFKLEPQIFNLHPSELKEGQTVGINLEDLGIKRATPQDVVAQVMNGAGFSKVTKSKGGDVSVGDGVSMRASLQQGENDNDWDVVGGSSKIRGLAIAALKKIRWRQPGQDGYPKTDINVESVSAESRTTGNESVPTPEPQDHRSGLHAAAKQEYDDYLPIVEKQMDNEVSDRRKAMAALGTIDSIGHDAKVAILRAIRDKHPIVFEAIKDRHAVSMANAVTEATEPALSPKAESADEQDKQLAVDSDMSAAIADEMANRKPEKRSEQAANRKEEAKRRFIEAGRRLIDPTSPTSGLDPRKVKDAVDMVIAAVEYGVASFDEFVSLVVEAFDEMGARDLAPYLEEAARQGGIDNVTTVADVLDKQTPKQPAKPYTAKEADGTTSTKHAKTDELRAKRGFPERVPPGAETFQEWEDEALRKYPDATARLRVVELAERNPERVGKIENAAIGQHIVDLENRRKAGEDVLDELLRTVKVANVVGSEAGRALVSRKAERYSDFSLAGIVNQHIDAAGKDPTDEQMQKYAELADKVTGLEGELDALKKKLAQTEVDKAIAEAAAAAKNSSPPKAGTKKATLRKKASAAVAAFKAEWATLSQLGAVNDPRQQAEKWVKITNAAGNVIKSYAELGVESFLELMASVKRDMGALSPFQVEAFKEAWETHKKSTKAKSPLGENPEDAAIGKLARDLTKWAVESGIEGREEVIDVVHRELQDMGFDISRSDTMAAMSGYGDFRELSKDELSVKVRGIKGEIQQLLKLEAMGAGQAPKKTGVERREPTDEERRLIQKVNEAKKRGGYEVTDPDRQLKTALGTAKTALANRIKDLEQEIQTREKIVRERTPLKEDAELLALRDKRDALLKEHRKIFPPKNSGLTDAQRLKMAEALLDRQIAELEADLAAGRLDTKAKRDPVTSTALDAKKAKKAALMEARERAREASPEYQAKVEAKRTAQYKKTLEKQLAFWESRRDEASKGRLPEKRKSTTPVDKEILEKKWQIELVKREARAEIEHAERAARSPGMKALGFGGDLLDFARAIQTGYELSATLRQGAFYTLGFPRQALPTLLKSIEAAFSRRADFALHDDLLKRPNHLEYMAGKLETTAADGPLSHREEALRSRIASWLSQTEGWKWAAPRWAAEGLLGSERAFRSFSNTMRADLFDYMKASVDASRPGTWSEDDAKVVGNASNVFSGRATMQHSVAWGRVLYAPRWVWSRALLSVGQPAWKGDKATRLAVGKVYVRAAIGFAALQTIKHIIYSLLAGDDDDHKPKYEFDPRSSDFGKMRIGDTRLDTGSGINQLATLVARLATGQTKRQSGEIIDLRGDNVPYGASDTADVMSRFLRTKLAPLPSGVVDWIVGENVVGENATVGKIIGDRLTPMTWSDIWDAEKELNVPQGTVAAIESFLGTGVATYGDRTKYRASINEERAEILNKDLKNLEWDSPTPAYAEFLTEDQLNKFDERKHDRYGLQVYHATGNPDSESTMATQKEAIAILKESGWTYEQAKEALIDYWERPDANGKKNSAREMKNGILVLKDAVSKRTRSLKKIFEAE